LGLSFCIDQISQALSHGEVELAIFESPSGELARLGKPAARDVTYGSENRLNDGPPAMDVQLCDVLSGEALRGWKPKDERLIECFPRVRPTQIAHSSGTRLWSRRS